MAINVVIPLLIPLEENIHNATRLLSGSGVAALGFTEPRYCAVLSEDAELSAVVTTVTAIHKTGEIVRYSITGGNRDGLFTIDQNTGTITLAAALDYELNDKHELVVAGEAGGELVHTLVQVRVTDVNDNAPFFLTSDPEVKIVEEDDRNLPATLIKVEAKDLDAMDHQGLLYTVRGDGVDGYTPSQAYFAINSKTGELHLLRALDRDPPLGRQVWRVRVQVRDGQALWSRQGGGEYQESFIRQPRSSGASPSSGDQDDPVITANNRNDVSHGSRFPFKTHFSSPSLNQNHNRSKRSHPKSSSRKPLSRSPNIHHQLPCSSIGHRINEILRFDLFSPSTARDLGSECANRQARNDERGHSTNLDSRHLESVLRSSVEKKQTPEGETAQSDAFQTIKASLTSSGIAAMANRDRKRFTSQPWQRLTTSAAKQRSRKSNVFHSDQISPMRVRRSEGNRSHDFSTFRPKTSIAARESLLESARTQNLRETYSNITFAGARVVPRRLAPRKPRETNIKQTNLQDPSQDETKTDKDPDEQEDSSCDELHGNGHDLKENGGGERILKPAERVVHVVETLVTVVVKDVNDNAPVFPNGTMFGEVQENGPINLYVCEVSAFDADDPAEGSNAQVTYSIADNAYDESGDPVFSLDAATGILKTAVCCLDRETTPEYFLQVVATDGGGLTGTGTVVVHLIDVNDNSPRLTRRLWQVDVNETWGEEPADGSTLLEITAQDLDTANYFFYRVVERSGWGWEHFGVRTDGAVGHLYARQTLDYEDETHRRGFKFMVQVTDRGRGGWDDSRHVDGAYVVVRLLDLNDNAPEFTRPETHVTVMEDAAPGTVLTVLTAHDRDKDGLESVIYHVEGAWGALKVDPEGEVRLWRPLDREAPDGEVGVARVIAVDSGQPPLSATATVTVTVTDVNDCPPVLLPPTVVHVVESSPPTLVATLTATDRDVWAMGHGPPFRFDLADTNPPQVKALLRMDFKQILDSGRGGAELWTTASIDREEFRQLDVQILLTDAGGVSATQVLTVVVDDINDNPMKPATKKVYLCKPRGSDAPLGRVYVDDPDDWDIKDKLFQWVGAPHPLFSLDKDTGELFASSQVGEGRYQLEFGVSDRLWGQEGVSANVTVTVRLLTDDALTHATPLTVKAISPADLTKGWAPVRGGGLLGQLMDGILSALGKDTHTIEVVSVHHAQQRSYQPVPPPFVSSSTSSLPSISSSSFSPSSPSSCVWVSVKEAGGSYINSVKLQGLLQMHSKQVSQSTNLSVTANDPEDSTSFAAEPQKPQDPLAPTPNSQDAKEPSSAASLSASPVPLQVVDINATSLVTPRLSTVHRCQYYEQEQCSPKTCLNGGRCVGFSGENRCICPGITEGLSCKVPARSFGGAGWAWVKPLPPCLPASLSLRLLTRSPHALILYSGPLAPAYPRRKDATPTPLLAIQLMHGRPQLLLYGEGGQFKLALNATVHDGRWHTLHVRIQPKGVVFSVNLCGRHDSSSCMARATWAVNSMTHSWFRAHPIQLGGVAHSQPRPEDHFWNEAPTTRPLDGCISHLRVNGQLVDLGEPPYAQASAAGCRQQEEACAGGLSSCGFRGKCMGGLVEPECVCDSGWTGRKCATPTVPVAFSSSSYVKVAVAMPSRDVKLHLRVRTRRPRDASLVHISSRDHLTDLHLHLRAGIICASLGRDVVPASSSVCVERHPVADGEWHIVRAERQGHSLVVSVDDGDSWRRNESLADFEEGVRVKRGRDVDDGWMDHSRIVVIGEARGLETEADTEKHTCIDDLRVNGRSLPLAPALNVTPWAEVKTAHQIEVGCTAVATCGNETSCSSPLSCFSTWGKTTCSCGPGRQLVDRTCEDVNECLWRPCLHGGTCQNMRPGFLCVCGPGHTGDFCQWTKIDSVVHPLSGPLAIVALTLSVILVVVMGVVFSVKLHRHWHSGGVRGRGGGGGGGKEGKGGGAEEEGEAYLEETEDGRERRRRKHRFLSHLSRMMPMFRATRRERTTCLEKEATPMEKEATLLEEELVTCLPESLETKGLKDSVGVGVVPLAGPINPTESILSKDDLRAYAYEGDGNSSVSALSVISGLRTDQVDEGGVKPLVPGFLDVLDLLRHLPDGSGSPPFSRAKTKGKGTRLATKEGANELGDSTVLISSTSLPPTHPPIPSGEDEAFEDDLPTFCVGSSSGTPTSPSRCQVPPSGSQVCPPAKAEVQKGEELMTSC